MDVFRALLHDASRQDGAAHRALRLRTDGWALGPLVVGDDRLTGLDPDVDLSVVTSGGAGSVAALPGRTAGLRLVAVETVLRDLDDLPGNAGRVVAAAAGLPDDVEVFVGLPAGTGLVEAVEVVEAAGLRGRITVGPGAARLLSALVESDLPFKATGLGPDPVGPYGLLGLLMAVEALVDGADPEDADALLADVDAHRAVTGLAGWDEATQARVRRRLRAVDCDDPATTLDALARAGLL
ncbi:hypothetical protein SAMN04488544_0495 [Microlunatus sagamiharensis]|uniref:Uncharacterized protein n=1 Tax=Microlunatus sagamiharensis TaxID=546874 RepID=A0A1H2LMC3_9ACTN|nr:hypothetical protein [Microlunatus sagamiharensis]SDU82153.1 hypothetical protein SAMN04488544_0495 [Microlunatus sagamiharensis]